MTPQPEDGQRVHKRQLAFRTGIECTSGRRRAGAGCSGGFELEPDSEPQLTEVTQGDSDSGSTSESQGLGSDWRVSDSERPFAPAAFLGF